MNWRRFAPGGPLAEVALAIVATAAGALVYHRFFSSGYLPVLAVACLVGGVTAALGHRRTWATPALAVTGLTLFMVYGVFGGAASAVVGGVRGSWNRLLTVTAPADTWGELLAAPALVTWAAAFSSVVLVLRTRNALAPLFPPLVSLLFALFVVGNQAGAHPVATAVFLVVALVLVAIRTHRGTGGTVRVERQSTRPVAVLVAVGSMLAASALFGVVGGQALPLASGDRRFDPRDVVAPPVVRTDTLTPLAQLKRQLNESPPRTLFTVRTEQESTRIDRVRTAALDTFDGTTWTSTDTYRVAGSRLTVDPALSHSKPVTAHVELKDFSGPYLPVVGWPSRLTAPGETRGGFGFNPESGVVVSAGPTPRGLSYDVTGEVGLRDRGLAWATPSENYLPPLPAGRPPALDNDAAKWFDGPPYDRLVALEDFLRAKSYQLNRPPGHSYATIARLMAAENPDNGYSEQNAAAFTVLARMWGYPARVAVGYRLRNYQGGVFQVTTADAHAWSEVHFSGYGWVAFDPTNPDDKSKPNPPPEAPRVVPPQPAPSTTALAAAPPAASQPADRADDQGFSWGNVLHGSVLLVPAAVLLVVLAAGFVVLAKARRRGRRRRAPDHATRVLGAWHEQMDRLTERGISPPVSLTFHEVAGHVRAVLGDVADPIETTAELATTAIYAPDRLGPGESEQAWELVARLNAGLYPGRASAARLLTALDPRPLWTSWSVARRRRLAGEGLEMGRYR